MERNVGLIPLIAPEFERELGRRQWEQPTSYPAPTNIEVIWHPRLVPSESRPLPTKQIKGNKGETRHTPTTPEFERELGRRQWEQPTSYPAPTNIEVVKEFYTNARSFGGNHEITSYVKGKRIPYDAATINSFLGTVWTGEQCQFASAIEEEIDYEEVERTLCMQGGHFQRNRRDLPIHIRRSFLTSWQSVNTSSPPFEQPRKEINASYYTQYCMPDEEGVLVPGPQPPRAHRRHPQAAQQEQVEDAMTFRMRDMYMSLIESKLEALYRGDGGAGASGAVAMEEEDDDEDEEDDAEDEKDEEDDEDSDDSRG
ncbi:hypothetical protein LR48_Vigan04g100100 [Vigna angularis]|uniref:Putative plant transposon protein domain-containing protein n=1 Tax=Phaseolus angularis TaxID=3914 RepID=A0A0L9UDG4_PHAAN|nr:hypothetical protein LR48_Vigan04g100100 [Vigna angularis]